MKEDLKKLSNEAYEAVASAHHWGDGFSDAGKTVDKKIQEAYNLGKNESS